MANLFYRHILGRGLNLSRCHRVKLSTAAQESAPSTQALLPTRVYYSPTTQANIRRSTEFFGLQNLYTFEDMMEARLHFGHKERMLNEHMRPYIFGKRLGVLILDLEQTHQLLQQALVVTAEIAYRNGIILFVHQSRQNGHLVETAARECNEFAYCRRWDGDILTNSQKKFGAVTRLPDLMLIMSVVGQVNEQHKAVNDAAKMLIPTVGICDTNADPTLVTYPVPANDDSPESIEFLCRIFRSAVQRGKEKRKEVMERQGEDYYERTLAVDS